ncbi:BGTF surface domain-containing protein [Halorubrum depositum]|uniref:BGTF surface domain-containing protein n=1 Tax=Halorubrum depositum TaxID=2583992 RepID=UPI0019D53D3B|nr:BGTF surface domain-containing protein [Halorubrum depositum]
MTSRAPPDGADPSERTTSAGSGSCRREEVTEDESGGAALRAWLSTLSVVLVALAVCLSLFGAAATATAAATVSEEDAVAVGGGDAVSAIETDGAAERGDAVSREIDGSFSRPTYTGTAGDVVEIRHAVDASGDDTAYLLVGGNRLTDSGGTIGFVDVLRVSGGSTTINTRLIGTNESDVDSCSDDDVSCDLEFRNGDGDVIADSLGNLSGVGSTGAGGLARPLVPERYRLAITNGTFVVRDSGAVDPVEVAAESDLVLREPSFRDEVEVFTTADADVIADGEEGDESVGALRENGLDRTAVTKGDRVVLGFEATGIWGALSHFADRRSGESGEDGTAIEAGTAIDHRVLVDLLEAEEGVSLTVRQTNPGRNERRAELDLADADPDDVTLFLAEAEQLRRGDADRSGLPGRFYLAIDTSDGGPFTEDVEPGDEFAVEFALEGTESERYAFRDGGEPPAAFDPASATDDRISEQYPYHGTDDGRVSAEASFGVRERYLRYDDVTDDGDLLVETDDGTITGTTSILPVTELSATIVRDTNETPNRTESELAIEDGNFTVDSGLAGVPPGARASYRLYRGQSLQDSRTVIVVENASDPDRLRLANATTTNLTVTRGESLGNLSAAVRNVGQLRNRERLTLDVDDGEIVEERRVTVAPGDERNETFEGLDADLEPGEYPYSLTIDGDRVNGTLIVEADPAVTRVDDGDADGEGATDQAGDGTGDAEDGTDGGGEPDDTDGDGSSDGGSGEEFDDDGEAPDEGPPDEAPATLLPFGIGTRETFGGTVLVGATYILGHWV